MKRNLVEAFAGLRAALLAGIAGLALVADARASGQNFTISASGPGGGVGTLPASAGNGIEGLPVGPFAPWGGGPSEVPSSQGGGATRPALALRGTDAELDHLIALAYSPDGTGWFHLEAPAPSGIRTITFYGHAVVLLERSALRANAQAPALAVAPSHRPLLAVLTSGEGQHAVQALAPGFVPLPLDRALGTGLLASGLVLEAKERGGATVAHLAFVAEGPRIRIEQRQ